MSKSGHGEAPDPVLEALDSLIEALGDNVVASNMAIERAAAIRDLRSRGLPYREIADETGRPMVVTLVTESLVRLRTAGAALRRAQAGALHDEGLTMEDIANLFGVTRQRISAILQSSP